MRYDIKRGNTVIANIRPTGKITSRIMGEELVNMSFALVRKIEFAMGDYVDVKGRRYYLLDSPTIVQKSTKEWQYTLNFKSVKYRLTDVSMLFYDELNNLTVPTFDIMGTAEKMIDLVITNANRDQSGWTKGIIDNTETKLVSFDDINCLSALAKIADEFKLEYWIDADQSIHFTERKPQANITLEYGRNKGLKTLTQAPLADASIVTRLRVKGSDKNLPIKYRNGQKSLRIDVPYLEKNIDKYGVIEHTETFDDIYPHRIGTVTSVDANNPYVFTDNTIDFDLNATDGHGNTTVLIKGLSAKVTFQTGQLAGYVLEIKEYGYNSQTKTFTLLPNKEEKAWNIPSDIIRPAVGDTYILSDIQMPAQYVTNAEALLKAKGQDYLNLNSTQRFTYTGESDPLLFKALNYQLSLGSMIRLKSVEFSLDSDVRITGLTEDLQNPYDIQPDFSDVTYTSSIVRQFYKQEKQQQTIIKEQRYNAAAARAAYYFGLELSEKTFDSEGYFDVNNIKPASINTKLISLGGRMQQFALPDVNFYLENNYTSLRYTSGRIVHATIADTPRTWYIPATTILNLSAVYQYVYIKCQRNGTNANILVTPNQITVEQDPDFFHFESGYISSIQNGFRVCKMTYGFAQINPQEISIGRWTSPVGGDYIAFNESGIEIKGKVTFASDSPALNQVQEKIDAVQVGSVNLLDNSAVFAMSANDVGLGTSVLIENESEKFYRATPDNGKRVSLYGIWYTLESNQEYVRGIYVRHSASVAQDVRVFNHNSNVGGEKITTIQPNTWTFIKTNTIIGSGGNTALILEMFTPNTPLDYKKTILVKGNRLGNDWMPSSNDVNNEITIAKQNAANAQNTANTAVNNAAIANQRLADIANDNKLTPEEKSDTIKEWDIIADEYLKLIPQASTYGVDTNAYTGAKNALSSYLISISYNNLNTTSDINGTEFRQKFRDYYDAKVSLLKAISDAAKAYATTLVDNIKIGGVNLMDYSENPLKQNPASYHVDGVIADGNFSEGGFYQENTRDYGYSYIELDYAVSKMQVGKEYTISFEAWNLNKTKICIGWNNVLSFTFEDAVNTGDREWKRYSKTLKLNAPDYRVMIIMINELSGAANAYRRFKIEEGNKATPWTVSQADIDRQLKKVQDDANIANQKLSDIASDNKLTPSEKQDTMKEWAVIYNERPELIATAAVYGVSAVVYDGKVNDLAVYLTNIGYSDLSYTSNINGNDFRQKFVDVYTAKADLIKRISDTTRNYTNSTTEAAKIEMAKDARNKALAASYASGNCLNRDVDFRNGLNGIQVYNNAGNGNVSFVHWIGGAPASQAPTKSTNVLAVEYNGQGADPYNGGFYFGTQTRANAVFVVRIIMKLATGQEISFHSNQAGDSFTFDWTTPIKGTGKWEEYIGILRCGATGVFSSSMFFAFAGASVPLSTYICYASVFDLTDVDRYLEDRIKQNEQQTALAMAQANNAQNTANRVSQITSFLNTTVDGNVVASGTMLVGDVNGGNAGLTGVTDRGADSVRLFLGSNYANKNKAPLVMLDKGLIQMHHPNGVLGFEMGIVNGKLVFNVYDNSGNKTMEMGSQGIIFSNYIPDSWDNYLLLNIPSGSTNSDADFENFLRGQLMINTYQNDTYGWCNVDLNTNNNYWRYSAGVSYDSANYKQYEKFYYDTDNSKQKPGPSTPKKWDGWYAMPAHAQGSDAPVGGMSNWSITILCIRLAGGEQVQTKNISMSGSEFIHP
ncbi:hypothetical protein [Elizabethkingia meningoseptica]|uniref:hypothetical protein n=1 Tax=Elizabethkingia meningoseptica TaxID=238 RepID=UPI0023B12979|nr:hypothetical protein [Elizabethkingia meningoseptica]MDE5439397.1 hypothetical protein [Elizabethkingia meningoseptica]MDE5516559.1 hypothetical protein [Elizabethkingia meningoseptica]MDN4033583.1 hypothetical protein [Elizabethkingia meningoseptica]